PTTSRHGPPRSTALVAAATPSKIPPAKDPKTDPRPASTTTIRAFRDHSRPIDGLIEYETVTSPPARPPKAVPRAKPTREVLPTGIPISAAASKSSAVARIARPQRAFARNK